MKRKGGTATHRSRPAHKVAQLGLLFALAICFSFVESLVPSPLPVPGIKLGLSNVVIMYAVFALKGCPALLLAVLKALFAALTRGVVAGMLALCGGVLSVLVMLLLLRLFAGAASYSAISMAGAVAHNLGQLAMAAGLLQLSSLFWYYFAVLVVAGVIMGLLTATLLRFLWPLLPQQK